MPSHRIAGDWSSLGAGVELVFADIECHLGIWVVIRDIFEDILMVVFA
jgi:hypothetical protein